MPVFPPLPHPSTEPAPFLHLVPASSRSYAPWVGRGSAESRPREVYFIADPPHPEGPRKPSGPASAVPFPRSPQLNAPFCGIWYRSGIKNTRCSGYLLTHTINRANFPSAAPKFSPGLPARRGPGSRPGSPARKPRGLGDRQQIQVVISASGTPNSPIRLPVALLHLLTSFRPLCIPVREPFSTVAVQVHS